MKVNMWNLILLTQEYNDHCSYQHNFIKKGIFKNSASKFQPSMRYEPMGSAKLVQCFCHCAVKYVKSYSLTKFVYYIPVDDEKLWMWICLIS